MKKKILFATASFQIKNFSARAVVEAAGYELIFNPFGKRLTEEQISEFLNDQIVGVIAGTEPWTASVLREAKLLKVISRCGVGLDNIDLETAKLCGISVFNTPNAPTRAVAELTLAHMLSLIRRITECDRALRQGRWRPLMGSLLANQTIGVIGFGHIGKMVVNLLQTFSPKIIVYDPYLVRKMENINFVDFDQLLKESDIVTLHLPYNQNTNYLIDRDELALMKQSALLINVARGGLINEEALLSAVEAGQLGGAALDCFETEPYIAGPLLLCEKIQATAHMGSCAAEARSLMETEACTQLVHGLQKHNLL